MGAGRVDRSVSRVGSVMLGAALCVALCSGAATAGTELVVGVRADTPPFSYAVDRQGQGDQLRDGLPMSNGYAGYMVRICNRALQAMAARHGENLAIRTREVTAQNRFDDLHDGAIDILCDPATVTDERIKTLNAAMPVYLSSVTFAQPDPFPPGETCRNVVAVVAKTTADAAAIGAILSGGAVWPRYTEEIRIALEAMGSEGGQSSTVSAPDGCDKRVIRYYDTHDALADDFCRDLILYYVGDVEIIQRQLSRAGCRDRSSIAAATFTDDRYAIFTRSSEVPPEKAVVLLDFLGEVGRQVLTKPSVLLQAYEDEFLRQSASQKLSAFLWSIADEIPTR